MSKLFTVEDILAVDELIINDDYLTDGYSSVPIAEAQTEEPLNQSVRKCGPCDGESDPVDGPAGESQLPAEVPDGGEDGEVFDPEGPGGALEEIPPVLRVSIIPR